VLANVGQRLLHDAVGIATQRARYGVSVLHPHLEVDLRSGSSGLLDQAANVRQRRLRSLGGRVLPRFLPKHSDHAAQLLKCLARRRAQQLGGLPHLRRRQVRPDLERTGVQRQQRDPVGEHVMHLAGDPGALRHPGPVFVQALISLRPQSPLTQCEDKLPSGPDEHPTHGGCERERGDQQDHRERVGRGTVDGEDQGGRDPQGGDEHQPGRAVHSQGEQGEEPGGRGRNRDRPQQETGQRNAERPAPSPPQQEAGQRSAGNINDHLRRGQRHDRVVECGAQEERPDGGAHQAHDCVDGPVATSPRTDRGWL